MGDEPAGAEPDVPAAEELWGQDAELGDWLSSGPEPEAAEESAAGEAWLDDALRAGTEGATATDDLVNRSMDQILGDEGPDT